MTAPGLLLFFIIVKFIVLTESQIDSFVLNPFALLWQDLGFLILFAGIERSIPSNSIRWAAYGAVVLYAAMSAPVMQLFSSPLTWPMLRAARGALSDSIQHHLSLQNIGTIVLVLAAGVLSGLISGHFSKRFSNRGWTYFYALLGLSSAFGYWQSREIETNGTDRNIIFALVPSARPRLQPNSVVEDWRRSPIHSSTDGDQPVELTPFSGSGAKRNIILVLLESTGAQYLAPYGSKVDPTPHLTRLAQESIVFEHAYSVYPESIKGLFSVLSSCYPAIDTPIRWYENIGNPALPELLRKHGYHTGLFHSGRFMYLGMEHVISDRGYEELQDAGQIGGEVESSFGVEEPATVKRILEWIDTLPSQSPFFLTYLPTAGHHPYISPEAGPFDEEDDRGRYLNSLHYGDQSIGALLDGLRQRGLYENSVLIFCGDHGEAFGEHPGNFGHTLYIYEENIRVPLIVAIPGITKRQIRVPAVASLLDLAPTILDLIGIEPPEHFQGVSLLSSDQRRMALFLTDYSLGLLGLVDYPWKYIYELESGRSRLFNLEDDPGEMHNCAAKRPDHIEAYSQRIRKWAAAQKGQVEREFRQTTTQLQASCCCDTK